MSIIEATVTRKPSGEPLCMEILLSPEDIDIPAKVKKIEYILQNVGAKMILIPA